MTRIVPLAEAAPVVRSKNAGAYWITLDAMFDRADRYHCVKESGAITADVVAAAYGRSVDEVKGPFYVDAALAIKVSVLRRAPAGDLDDADLYGQQQHIPFLAIRVPIPD